MIKLHYAPLVLDGDIPCYEFDEIDQIREYFEGLVSKVMVNGQHGNYRDSEIVYVFSYDAPGVNDEEVFVTSKIYFIADLFTQVDFFGFDLIPAFYLQEYASYEEAYKVALDMKETSPLCYPKD